MKKLMIVACAVMTATPVLAQDAAATARVLLLPMLQETAPGKPGEVLTDCVIATSTPEELAAFAAAPGPSMEIGASISTILARPEAISCMSAAVQQ